MRKVTLRGLLAHKLRLALTALAVVLGVTFISGTFVLTDTLNSTFSTLFSSVYSKIDFQVRGVAQFGSGESATRNPLPESVLARVQNVPGVDSVTLAVLQRMDDPWIDGAAQGFLIMGRLEIARCDNDPNRLDHGLLTLTLDGGK